VIKAEFIAEVRRSRAELDDALSQVDPADMLQPRPGSSWTVKDIVAHITWHEREMIGLIEQRALAGSVLWQLPLEQRNQAIHQENQDLGLEQVLEAHRQTFPRLLAALELLDDDALHHPVHFAGMPDDWSPADLIASNTYEHYADHSAELRAWLVGEEPAV
jgi:uncharacterized protein (TIGR03083 family)